MSWWEVPDWPARMRARARHPSRSLGHQLIRREFGRRPIRWLDVGIAGLVDYPQLTAAGLQVRELLAADRSASALREAAARISQGSGGRARAARMRLIRWDVQELPPPALGRAVDLLTCRHVLNHVLDGRAALRHLADRLRPTGLCLLTLHRALVDGTGWNLPEDHVYSADGWLGLVQSQFRVERWIRTGPAWKPNDVFVLRHPAYARCERPWRWWGSWRHRPASWR